MICALARSRVNPFAEEILLTFIFKGSAQYRYTSSTPHLEFKCGTVSGGDASVQMVAPETLASRLGLIEHKLTFENKFTIKLEAADADLHNSVLAYVQKKLVNISASIISGKNLIRVSGVDFHYSERENNRSLLDLTAKWSCDNDSAASIVDLISKQ